MLKTFQGGGGGRSVKQIALGFSNIYMKIKKKNSISSIRANPLICQSIYFFNLCIFADAGSQPSFELTVLPPTPSSEYITQLFHTAFSKTHSHTMHQCQHCTHFPSPSASIVVWMINFHDELYRGTSRTWDHPNGFTKIFQWTFFDSGLFLLKRVINNKFGN